MSGSGSTAYLHEGRIDALDGRLELSLRHLGAEVQIADGGADAWKENVLGCCEGRQVFMVKKVKGDGESVEEISFGLALPRA